MSVGIISISDSLGGAEQVLHKLAKFYSIEKNNKVRVFFLKSKTNQFWDDLKNYNVEVYYSNNNILALVKLLRNYRFSKIFSSHLMMNSFLGIFRKFKILNTEKLIVRESTSVFLRYRGLKLLKYKIAYFLGYNYNDLIICQTKEMEASILKYMPVFFKNKRLITITNPFDYPNQDLVNKTNDLTGDYIVSAGRLIKEKGFEVLIKAFNKIRLEYPHLKLIILGEGKLRKSLESLIDSFELQDKIFLLGHVKNVYSYFKYSKLCVVSSISEGFPNVLLQMMSQNINVVSTKCAGGIQDIQGLYLAEINDVESLKSAIVDCLKADNTDNEKIFNQFLIKNNVENYVYNIEANL